MANEILKDVNIQSGGYIGGDVTWGKEIVAWGGSATHWYHPETPPGSRWFPPEGNTVMSEEDVKEGQVAVAEAAKRMYGYKYSSMKHALTVRDYAQYKYCDAVFAVGRIAKAGEKYYPSRANDERVCIIDTVTGGTGYAVNMAIAGGKPVYVFNQVENDKYPIGWYTWSKEAQAYTPCEVPVLTQSPACIGSRELTEQGRDAIMDCVGKTVLQKTQQAVKQNEQAPKLVIRYYPQDQKLTREQFNALPGIKTYTENTNHTSGRTPIDRSSWLYRQYGDGASDLCYPSMTLAVMRGLPDTYPITTQHWYDIQNGRTGEKGRWVDSDIEEFKSVVGRDFKHIKTACVEMISRKMEYATEDYNLWLPNINGGLLETSISNITKERTPLLYDFLSSQIAELEEFVTKVNSILQSNLPKQDIISKLYNVVNEASNNTNVTMDNNNTQEVSFRNIKFPPEFKASIKEQNQEALLTTDEGGFQVRIVSIYATPTGEAAAVCRDILSDREIRIALSDEGFAPLNEQEFNTVVSSLVPQKQQSPEESALEKSSGEALHTAVFENLPQRRKIGALSAYHYSGFTEKAKTAAPAVRPTNLDAGELSSAVAEKRGVDTMSHPGSWDEYKGKPFHLGNPFGSVEDYMDWLIGAKHLDVEPERRSGIISLLFSGTLLGRDLLYTDDSQVRKELGEKRAPSHAHVLLYFVNHPDRLAVMINNVSSIRNAAIGSDLKIETVQSEFAKLSSSQMLSAMDFGNLKQDDLVLASRDFIASSKERLDSVPGSDESERKRLILEMFTSLPEVVQKEIILQRNNIEPFAGQCHYWDAYNWLMGLDVESKAKVLLMFGVWRNNGKNNPGKIGLREKQDQNMVDTMGNTLLDELRDHGFQFSSIDDFHLDESVLSIAETYAGQVFSNLSEGALSRMYASVLGIFKSSYEGREQMELDRILGPESSKNMEQNVETSQKAVTAAETETVDHNKQGELFVSYYGSRSIPEDAFKVQISTSPGKGFTVDYDMRSTHPDYKRMVEPHKNGIITDAEYTARYQNEVLSKKDAILSELQKIRELAGERDIYFLCYEKPGAFCHRYLLRDFFIQNGISCQENPADAALYQKASQNEETVTDEGRRIVNIWWSSNQHRDLSNAAHYPFYFNGQRYESIEQYYHDQKVAFSRADDSVKEKLHMQIRSTVNLSELRRLGASIPELDVDTWNANRYDVMREGMLLSYDPSTNARHAQILLDTGDAILTHAQAKGEWRYMMPNILMEVRDVVRSKHINNTTGQPLEPVAVVLTPENYPEKELEKVLSEEPEVIYHQGSNMQADAKAPQALRSREERVETQDESIDLGPAREIKKPTAKATPSAESVRLLCADSWFENMPLPQKIQILEQMKWPAGKWFDEARALRASVSGGKQDDGSLNTSLTEGFKALGPKARLFVFESVKGNDYKDAVTSMVTSLKDSVSRFSSLQKIQSVNVVRPEDICEMRRTGSVMLESASSPYLPAFTLTGTAAERTDAYREWLLHATDDRVSRLRDDILSGRYIGVEVIVPSLDIPDDSFPGKSTFVYPDAPCPEQVFKHYADNPSELAEIVNQTSAVDVENVRAMEQEKKRTMSFMHDTVSVCRSELVPFRLDNGAVYFGRHGGELSSPFLSELSNGWSMEDVTEATRQWLCMEDYIDVEPERRDNILKALFGGRLVGRPVAATARYAPYADWFLGIINDPTEIGEQLGASLYMRLPKDKAMELSRKVSTRNRKEDTADRWVSVDYSERQAASEWFESLSVQQKRSVLMDYRFNNEEHSSPEEIRDFELLNLTLNTWENRPASMRESEFRSFVESSRTEYIAREFDAFMESLSEEQRDMLCKSSRVKAETYLAEKTRELLSGLSDEKRSQFKELNGAENDASAAEKQAAFLEGLSDEKKVIFGEISKVKADGAKFIIKHEPLNAEEKRIVLSMLPLTTAEAVKKNCESSSIPKALRLVFTGNKGASELFADFGRQVNPALVDTYDGLLGMTKKDIVGLLAGAPRGSEALIPSTTVDSRKTVTPEMKRIISGFESSMQRNWKSLSGAERLQSVRRVLGEELTLSQMEDITGVSMTTLPANYIPSELDAEWAGKTPDEKAVLFEDWLKGKMPGRAAAELRSLHLGIVSGTLYDDIAMSGPEKNDKGKFTSVEAVLKHYISSPKEMAKIINGNPALWSSYKAAPAKTVIAAANSGQLAKIDQEYVMRELSETSSLPHNIIEKLSEQSRSALMSAYPVIDDAWLSTHPRAGVLVDSKLYSALFGSMSDATAVGMMSAFRKALRSEVAPVRKERALNNLSKLSITSKEAVLDEIGIRAGLTRSINTAYQGGNLASFLADNVKEKPLYRDPALERKEIVDYINEVASLSGQIYVRIGEGETLYFKTAEDALKAFRQAAEGSNADKSEERRGQVVSSTSDMDLDSESVSGSGLSDDLPYGENQAEEMLDSDEENDIEQQEDGTEQSTNEEGVVKGKLNKVDLKMLRSLGLSSPELAAQRADAKKAFESEKYRFEKELSTFYDELFQSYEPVILEEARMSAGEWMSRWASMQEPEKVRLLRSFVSNTRTGDASLLSKEDAGAISELLGSSRYNSLPNEKRHQLLDGLFERLDVDTKSVIIEQEAKGAALRSGFTSLSVPQMVAILEASCMAAKNRVSKQDAATIRNAVSYGWELGKSEKECRAYLTAVFDRLSFAGRDKVLGQKDAISVRSASLKDLPYRVVSVATGTAASKAPHEVFSCIPPRVVNESGQALRTSVFDLRSKYYIENSSVSKDEMRRFCEASGNDYYDRSYHAAQVVTKKDPDKYEALIEEIAKAYQAGGEVVLLTGPENALKSDISFSVMQRLDAMGISSGHISVDRDGNPVVTSHETVIKDYLARGERRLRIVSGDSKDIIFNPTFIEGRAGKTKLVWEPSIPQSVKVQEISDTESYSMLASPNYGKEMIFQEHPYVKYEDLIGSVLQKKAQDGRYVIVVEFSNIRTGELDRKLNSAIADIRRTQGQGEDSAHVLVHKISIPEEKLSEIRSAVAPGEKSEMRDPGKEIDAYAKMKIEKMMGSDRVQRLLNNAKLSGAPVDILFVGANEHQLFYRYGTRKPTMDELSGTMSQAGLSSYSSSVIDFEDSFGPKEIENFVQSSVHHLVEGLKSPSAGDRQLAREWGDDVFTRSMYEEIDLHFETFGDGIDSVCSYAGNQLLRESHRRGDYSLAPVAHVDDQWSITIPNAKDNKPMVVKNARPAIWNVYHQGKIDELEADVVQKRFVSSELDRYLAAKKTSSVETDRLHAEAADVLWYMGFSSRDALLIGSRVTVSEGETLQSGILSSFRQLQRSEAQKYVLPRQWDPATIASHYAGSAVYIDSKEDGGKQIDHAAVSDKFIASLGNVSEDTREALVKLRATLAVNEYFVQKGHPDIEQEKRSELVSDILRYQDETGQILSGDGFHAFGADSAFIVDADALDAAALDADRALITLTELYKGLDDERLLRSLDGIVSVCSNGQSISGDKNLSAAMRKLAKGNPIVLPEDISPEAIRCAIEKAQGHVVEQDNPLTPSFSPDIMLLLNRRYGNTVTSELIKLLPGYFDATHNGENSASQNEEVNPEVRSLSSPNELATFLQSAQVAESGLISDEGVQADSIERELLQIGAELMYHIETEQVGFVAIGDRRYPESLSGIGEYELPTERFVQKPICVDIDTYNGRMMALQAKEGVKILALTKYSADEYNYPDVLDKVKASGGVVSNLIENRMLSYADELYRNANGLMSPEVFSLLVSTFVDKEAFSRAETLKLKDPQKEEEKKAELRASAFERLGGVMEKMEAYVGTTGRTVNNAQALLDFYRDEKFGLSDPLVRALVNSRYGVNLFEKKKYSVPAGVVHRPSNAVLEVLSSEIKERKVYDALLSAMSEYASKSGVEIKDARSLNRFFAESSSVLPAEALQEVCSLLGLKPYGESDSEEAGESKRSTVRMDNYKRLSEVFASHDVTRALQKDIENMLSIEANDRMATLLLEEMETDEKTELRRQHVPSVLAYRGDISLLNTDESMGIIGVHGEMRTSMNIGNNPKAIAAARELVSNMDALDRATIAGSLNCACGLAAIEEALSRGVKVVAVTADRLDSPKHEDIIRRIVNAGGVVLSEAHAVAGSDKDILMARSGHLLAGISKVNVILENLREDSRMLAASPREALSPMEVCSHYDGDICVLTYGEHRATDICRAFLDVPDGGKIDYDVLRSALIRNGVWTDTMEQHYVNGVEVFSKFVKQMVSAVPAPNSDYDAAVSLLRGGDARSILVSGEGMRGVLSDLRAMAPEGYVGKRFLKTKSVEDGIIRESNRTPSLYPFNVFRKEYVEVFVVPEALESVRAKVRSLYGEDAKFANTNQEAERMVEERFSIPSSMRGEGAHLSDSEHEKATLYYTSIGSSDGQLFGEENVPEVLLKGRVVLGKDNPDIELFEKFRSEVLSMRDTLYKHVGYEGDGEIETDEACNVLVRARSIIFKQGPDICTVVSLNENNRLVVKNLRPVIYGSTEYFTDEENLLKAPSYQDGFNLDENLAKVRSFLLSTQEETLPGLVKLPSELEESEKFINASRDEKERMLQDRANGNDVYLRKGNFERFREEVAMGVASGNLPQRDAGDAAGKYDKTVAFAKFTKRYVSVSKELENAQQTLSELRAGLDVLQSSGQGDAASAGGSGDESVNYEQEEKIEANRAEIGKQERLVQSLLDEQARLGVILDRLSLSDSVTLVGHEKITQSTEPLLKTVMSVEKEAAVRLQSISERIAYDCDDINAVVSDLERELRVDAENMSYNKEVEAHMSVLEQKLMEEEGVGADSIEEESMEANELKPVLSESDRNRIRSQVAALKVFSVLLNAEHEKKSEMLSELRSSFVQSTRDLSKIEALSAQLVSIGEELSRKADGIIAATVTEGASDFADVSEKYLEHKQACDKLERELFTLNNTVSYKKIKLANAPKELEELERQLENVPEDKINKAQRAELESLRKTISEFPGQIEEFSNKAKELEAKLKGEKASFDEASERVMTLLTGKRENISIMDLYQGVSRFIDSLPLVSASIKNHLSSVGNGVVSRIEGFRSYLDKNLPKVQFSSAEQEACDVILVDGKRILVPNEVLNKGRNEEDERKFYSNVSGQMSERAESLKGQTAEIAGRAEQLEKSARSLASIGDTIEKNGYTILLDSRKDNKGDVYIALHGKRYTYWKGDPESGAPLCKDMDFAFARKFGLMGGRVLDEQGRVNIVGVDGQLVLSSFVDYLAVSNDEIFCMEQGRPFIVVKHDGMYNLLDFNNRCFVNKEWSKVADSVVFDKDNGVFKVMGGGDSKSVVKEIPAQSKKNASKSVSTPQQHA